MTTTTFPEFTKRFLEWTEREIEAKKSDGFAVCPYAKQARVNRKIQFIDGRTNTQAALEAFDKDCYEIGIVWLGDDADIPTVEELLPCMKRSHPDLLYFTSTPTSGYFAKNFTNCVFIQLDDDITQKRNQLHNTKYYDSWPEQYYKLIMG